MLRNDRSEVPWGTNIERVARDIAEKVISRSPLAQAALTAEQRRQHVEACWPEYAEMLVAGEIDEEGWRIVGVMTAGRV